MFFCEDIDSQETYQFGQVEVSKAQLFYKTHLTMAFVNKMPVLNGRILFSMTHRILGIFIIFIHDNYIDSIVGYFS